LFIETLLRDASAVAPSSGFHKGTTGADIYANLGSQHVSCDKVTWIVHLTQTVGPSKVYLEGALTLNGPWIEMASFTSANLSDAYETQVDKMPLFRARIETAGTTLLLTSAIMA